MEKMDPKRQSVEKLFGEALDMESGQGMRFSMPPVMTRRN